MKIVNDTINHIKKGFKRKKSCQIYFDLEVDMHLDLYESFALPADFLKSPVFTTFSTLRVSSIELLRKASHLNCQCQKMTNQEMGKR